jgi:tetratricopeptide (TPR) repeat protein
MMAQTAKLAPEEAPSGKLFGTAEVARILNVSPHRIRELVRAGLCRPARRGRYYRYSFQDLVLLRTARGLLQQKIPGRRVRRALRELSKQLPHGRSATGVKIYADGAHVAVRYGSTAWHPHSKQMVFLFEVDQLARDARVVAPAHPKGKTPAVLHSERTRSAALWFERALLLEERHDVVGAASAYRRALDFDSSMADAYINLGRLVHQGGDPREAARLYHNALVHAPNDPIAHYNLALALEDQDHRQEAITHYEEAVNAAPDFADAHFNLSRLYERMSMHRQAVRHLLVYKKLTES